MERKIADQRKGGIEIVIRLIAKCAECPAEYAETVDARSRAALHKFEDTLRDKRWRFRVNGWICPKCVKKHGRADTK